MTMLTSVGCRKVARLARGASSYSAEAFWPDVPNTAAAALATPLGDFIGASSASYLPARLPRALATLTPRGVYTMPSSSSLSPIETTAVRLPSSRLRSDGDDVVPRAS